MCPQVSISRTVPASTGGGGDGCREGGAVPPFPLPCGPSPFPFRAAQHLEEWTLSPFARLSIWSSAFAAARPAAADPVGFGGRALHANALTRGWRNAARSRLGDRCDCPAGRLTRLGGATKHGGCLTASVGRGPCRGMREHDWLCSRSATVPKMPPDRRRRASSDLARQGREDTSEHRASLGPEVVGSRAASMRLVDSPATIAHRQGRTQWGRRRNRACTDRESRSRL